MKPTLEAHLRAHRAGRFTGNECVQMTDRDNFSNERRARRNDEARL